MTFHWRKVLAACALLPLLLTAGVVTPLTLADKVRSHTRPYEFDYSAWTLAAMGRKTGQASSGMPFYISEQAQGQIVMDYFAINRKISILESEIQAVYADPTITNKEENASQQLSEQRELKEVRNSLSPIVESVIQQQLAVILNEIKLTFIGQPMPPVLYQVSDLPMDLIISPRDSIRMETSVSLEADLSLDSITDLEKQVEEDLGISALVVPVGGIGTYPTMVMNTTDLAWQLEVVAHEWIHNYLTLHPLGMNYDASPELRTMNETTANLAGKEIAAMIIGKFYPQLGESAEATANRLSGREMAGLGEPPVIDFNRTMHATRVRVEELLSQGRIELAEEYMEYMRAVLWSNGYRIRRLNQAYFAFYGAYADGPPGAAGEDPVGPAVTRLREQSGSLLNFLKEISTMSSYAQLLAALEE